MNRKGKLNILEPWEYGTSSSIEAHIVGKHQNQYLILIPDPLSIRGMTIKYLVGELRDRIPLDISENEIKGTFALNLAYSDKINEVNFKEISIKNFRGNFLVGEMIF